MKPKQILVIEPAGNLWGSEKVLLDFLQAEKNADEFEMTVCYPLDSPIEKELKKLPVQLLPCFIAELHHKSRLLRLLFVLKITLNILRIKPDLIYVNQAGATRSMIPSAWLLGIPIVSHVRLLEDANYIASCFSRFFDHIYPVAISPFIYKALEAKNQIPQDKISWQYDIYLPKENNDKYQKSIDGYPFVCIGRLAYGKGQDILLDALSVLKNSGYRYGVRFVGAVTAGDDFDGILEAKCDQLRLNDVVEWEGYQTDVFAIKNHAIALVCPSRMEPLGRVIFEAWDMGLVPIVWKGSGGAAELVFDSGGGLIYEEQSGECLAKMMKTVINISVKERQKFIEKGRAWMQIHCSAKSYLSQMNNTFMIALGHDL